MDNSPNTPSEVGAVIRAAREALGLTRREVAQALGLNEQYLYQVETGRRAVALQTLWDIAVYLDADPNSFDPRLAPRRIDEG